MTAAPIRLPHWEREIASSPAASSCSPALTVYCFDLVTSTMDVARELLAQNLDRNFLCMARAQSKGRGRHGRPWSSEYEGFYATYCFPVRSELAGLAGFSLAAGCAVRRMLLTEGLDVKLKWPNDILSPTGQKLGGILVEIVSQGGSHWVLTGIGINLCGHPPLDIPTSSLHAQGARALSPPEAAVRLNPYFCQVWNDFIQKGFASFREEWLSAAFGLAQEIEVDTGSELVRGFLAGVDPKGALLVQQASGTTAIISGHVRFISL